MNDPDGMLPQNTYYEGGFGCVSLGLGSPGGTIDASSPCPPGTAAQYNLGGGSTMTRTEKVFSIMDPLSGVLDDWEYANSTGTRFNLWFSSSSGNRVGIRAGASQVLLISSFLQGGGGQAGSFYNAFLSFLENALKIPQGQWDEEFCERVRKEAEDQRSTGTLLAGAGTIIGGAGTLAIFLSPAAPPAIATAAVGTTLTIVGAAEATVRQLREDIAKRHCRQ